MSSIVKGFPLGWPVPAKYCDSCKTVVALLFCRKDTAFLCIACDVKIHSHTRHERVWMCEVCEHAPASVTCKADAAALCVTCDRDIHSANPLSRRHDRVPVVPFYDRVDVLSKPSACVFLDGHGSGNDDIISSVTNDDDIDIWPIPIDSIKIDTTIDVKSVEMLFPVPETDNLLDFDFPVATDSVVPFGPPTKNYPIENGYEIDFARSNINAYSKTSYLPQSFSNSVSSSSIEVGIVPEGSCLSEISHSFGLQTNMVNESQQLTALSGADRKARVMRYREKRKNRKFEKTIRYASRKAYAETRPRIKGRFAKRTESVDSETDRWLFNEVEYGVVPSCF